MARLPGLYTLLRLFRSFAGEAGSVAPLTALLLIPLAGSIAIATEQGEWYYFKSSMQNAADVAALAAAINNNRSGSGSTYQAEASAAAAKFGYVNGQNHAAVATAIVTCPANTAVGATCYQTSISTVVPLSFSALVGFTGNSAYGAGRGQLIPASAIAAVSSSGTQFCVMTMSSASTSFQSNGGPKPDLAGCSIYSGGGATCNGHNLSADYGYAVDTDSGCGINQVSNAPVITDPYAPLASHIPANGCGGNYPQEPATKSGNALPASNKISGTISSSTNYCGDIQLTGDVTIMGSGTAITINNGQLDTNGHTISTAAGAGATIIFSGTNGAYTHYPTGGGTLNIQAPTSGTWSGVAIYQNPSLTQGVSFTYSGNTPTWDITGLVYLPNANVTFSGAVNKSANGAQCFVMVAYTMLVNGSADIFANDTQCATAGLTPPGTAAVRPKLVQ